MTVHMIEVRAGQPAGVSIEDARRVVNNWLDKHTRALTEEERSLELIDYEDVPGSPYFLAKYRFTLNSTKSTLIDQIENALQRVVPWYVVKYHGCYHDGEEADCSWNRVETFGTVPSGVEV